MKRTPLLLTVGLLLVVILGAILLFVQVRRSTVVVITTFGRPTRTLTEPGLYMKLPPPIQMVHVFDQRIQNFDDKLDESFTADHYTLDVMVYAGWKINDATNFFAKFANGSIAEAESKMEGMLRSAKSAVVGKHPLADFVSTDEKQLKFDAIEHEILALVQDQVNQRNYGIELEFLGIKKLGFPDAVTQKVFDQMTSERAVLSSKIQYEGESEASKIRSSAESRSTEIMATATAQAKGIEAEAQAQAAKSFEVFQKNPELANFLLSLNALELSLKDGATLIFDQHTQPFNLLQGYSTNLTNPNQK
jgi:membrane protease subunit HflC